VHIKGEKIAICFVSNQSYLQHFYAALYSFLKTNPGDHFIFLFNEDVDADKTEEITRFIKDISPESTFKDVKIDTTKVDHFTGYWEKLGKQTFYRLLIPNLLQETFKYVLYVDSDIIFRRPIEFEEFSKENVICAVKDTISDILAPERGLEKYFNAGVILIDVQAWQANSSLEKLLNAKPKRKTFADQELLNDVFENRWTELPIELNYPAHRLRFKGFQYIGRDKVNPHIVHYLGGIKPWIFWLRGSLLYWSAVWFTPYRWQVLTIPKTILNSLLHKPKKLLKRIQKRLNLKKASFTF